MDHTSLRTQLILAVGYVAGRLPSLLRRIVREHTPDDAERVRHDEALHKVTKSAFAMTHPPTWDSSMVRNATKWTT